MKINAKKVHPLAHAVAQVVNTGTLVPGGQDEGNDD
jgi:hypothetical protein